MDYRCSPSSILHPPSSLVKKPLIRFLLTDLTLRGIMVECLEEIRACLHVKLSAT